MEIKESILKNLKKIVRELTSKEVEIVLSIPERSQNGDYSTNLAMRLSSVIGKKPQDIAEQIKREYEKLNDKNVEKVETAGPGFLNFFLSAQALQENLTNVISAGNKFGEGSLLSGKKIMVEFAHPNTHKEFHIGHLRNITTGESIVRLLSAQGAKVSRVNYQGDVGMHVAKAIYGLQDLKIDIEKSDKLSSLEKAAILGKAYAAGSKKYEEDEGAKKEIVKINKQIYAKDPEVLPLWEKTRVWSLEYFETVYERVGTHFDRLFFESEVYENGKKIVLSHVEDGIFVQDQGAIIFPGEKYGLHNRVFVTGEGNPTYEGKEMGLGPLQYSEFKFDLALHVVGPEQAGYFDVVFKALETVDPKFVGREKHLPYGFVQLKDGKMSSRLGNIVRGEWLLDEAREKIKKNFPELSSSIAETVAVAAVKYSLLRFGRTSDIQFSFDESISLDGNSGPYILYTYVRTQSILGKVKEEGIEGKIANNLDFEQEEKEVASALVHFPEIVENAASTYSPNLIANYLFDLAQKFNLFYQKHQILNTKDREVRAFRLMLTAATGQVVKNGLALLGIETVARM